LKPALRHGIITQREKVDLPYIEDAVRYVKLLFSVSQKGRLSGFTTIKYSSISRFNSTTTTHDLLKDLEKN
jgi:hypothetical protein